jgi:hypothetical protein
VRLLRGAAPQPGASGSAERVFDGVLFPVLALLLALLARWVLHALGLPVALFKLMVPVLVSAGGDPTDGARAAPGVSAVGRLMRVVERTVSWLAWLGDGAVDHRPAAAAAAESWTASAGRSAARRCRCATWSKARSRGAGAGAGAVAVGRAREAGCCKGATDNLSMRKMAANACARCCCWWA